MCGVLTYASLFSKGMSDEGLTMVSQLIRENRSASQYSPGDEVKGSTEKGRVE